MPRKHVCMACNGEGLLMDDEEWKYTCKVCDGSGVMTQGTRAVNRDIADVDEMNRILD